MSYSLLRAATKCVYVDCSCTFISSNLIVSSIFSARSRLIQRGHQLVSMAMHYSFLRCELTVGLTPNMPRSHFARGASSLHSAKPTRPQIYQNPGKSFSRSGTRKDLIEEWRKSSCYPRELTSYASKCFNAAHFGAQSSNRIVF